ncbi:MAG: glycine cleavage system aminomethyltransferase GcvT [Candidatus Heimdallarchaeota archaeon]|nr:MAG: glycine cleavage system aminomethyltransferase GcvT [Candidatus Heimdallarchaeota archaeon]
MKTQLYDWHTKNGDIINFSGFEMPVMYKSIKEEHMVVRNAAGLFDVSHMGRMWIEGYDSEKFLNLLVPRDLTKTQIGRASYTFMLNEQGGFRDDLVFARIDKNKWLLVWNAGNLIKIKLWMNMFKEILTQFMDLNLTLTEISSSSAMFALQGPKAQDVAITAFKGEIEPPLPWCVHSGSYKDIELILSGTGYTGEKGFEIIVLDTTQKDPSKAERIWELLLESGSRPCGLGARDSLRLEAGLALYGNDIDEEINPIEADLFFPPFIHMDKPYFIGKSHLEYLSDQKPNRTRVGFVAKNKGPSPREGVKLFKEKQEIGIVTSGGFSPLLNLGVGMGYVLTALSKEGTSIQFEVRGKLFEAEIVKFPIFNIDKYGKNRK